MREVKIGKYRHFKGKIITVLYLAKDSETLEDLVVYKHDEDNQICFCQLLTMKNILILSKNIDLKKYDREY